MDPKNQSDKKLPSLRTYAKDLEYTRKEKNLPTDTAFTEAVPAKAPTPIAPRKKEPLITATPAPKPKVFARTKTTKETPPPAPIGEKKPLPKLPTFTVPNDTTFIVDNEDAATATIITDTKRDRFKFFPSLFSSIKEWFSDKKQARAAKNTPKYTVPESSHRKGVIQRATSTTGKSATADFASIQERIKQRKAHVEKGKSHTTWSANTEPAFLLLEGSVAEPVTNVKMVSRKSFRTPPVAPPIVHEVAPIVVPAPIVPPAPEIITPEVEVPDIISEPEPAPEVVEMETDRETEEVVAIKSFSARHRFLSLNTNLLSLIISGVALALLLAVAFSYVLVTKSTDTDTNVEAEPVAILKTSSFSPITDTALTQEALIAKLAILPKETAVISEFVFASTTKTAFSPQEIISTLGVSTAQDFTQAIKTLHFGYVANTEPYLLMEVTDTIAARGGLLAWEEYLYTDFAAIFSTNTKTLNSSLKFIDSTFAGRDVRILKDENGNEIAIYGMLNTTILITTNSRTFSEVANLIQ